MPYSSMLNPQGLKILAANYLHEVDLTPIDKAWDVVTRVHGGKLHFSGESYLIHLLEVASTLASMQLDLDTVLAGLLHGVLKEGVAVEELEREFGPDVAAIVAGSTKINKLQYNSKLVNHAENVRKMLLAIAADIRVLLVKLIDRLQDLFMLDKVNRETQLEIAQETMDLYAPLASRLGIDWLKRELEDYSFKFLYPEDYADLNAKLESSLEERQEYVDEVISILHTKLGESEIKATRILGRPKHIYSIYKKLITQNIPFEQVYDKVAFRIIVENVKECYEALGIIHANWAPVPGRIKDFISVPKSNNYQSMHTTVVGPRGHFIEIQIRTEEMDRIAQEGVAAHWAYKEGQKANDRDSRLFRELKNLVKSLQEVEDPREFLESVRGELYDPDVYALTPAGDVKEFPQGSCPIDFAYSIHTEVGNHCVGAKVNGRLVQLKYELQNGDIIEIVTSPTQTPRRGWLDLVKTSRAKSRIRSWLRRDDKEKALKLGREICERKIKAHDTTLKKMIKSGHIRLLLKELRCNSLDDMLVKVGKGSITVHTLVKALQPPELAHEHDGPSGDASTEEIAATILQQQSSPSKDGRPGISIDGVEGMLMKISKCCSPLPGDPIIGFITQGRGVSIHKQNCLNLQSTDPHRWLDVSWSGLEDKHYNVSIHIRSENKRGIFAEISAVISSDNANIVDLSGHTTLEDTADLHITMEVRNLEHLQVILQHIKQMEHVISVRRV
jgi:GTP pyrophosphokinase